MRIPHYIYVYRKPAVANTGTAVAPVSNEAFLGKWLAYEYRHRVNEMGGFDTASARIDVEPREAEFVFSNRVGNRVAVYANNPMFPIWEGIISRVTIKRGGLAISRSIDEMVNRAQVVWTRTTATPQTQITAEVSGLRQGSYGSKGGMIEAGNQYTGGDTLPLALRNKIINQYSNPQISTIFEGGSDYEVRIEMLGFYHTLNWDIFAITDTTVLNAHEAIQRLAISSVASSQSGYNSGRFAGNGRGRFFDTESSRIISPNASFTTTIEKRAGETHWQKMVKIAEAGDGTRDWIVGVTRTDPNLRKRELYYMPVTTEIRYFLNVATGRITDRAGKHLEAYEVGPNNVVQVRDMLIGSTYITNDPRTVRIQTVEYDAEAGETVWTSKDALNASGVFGLGKVIKQHGKNFGANERVVYI